MVKITIPLPPITKKNHQEIRRNRKTGKTFIAQSRQYEQYEKDAMWFIHTPEWPINEPVNVKRLFYMPTRRRVDLVNLLEAIDDILVRAGVLADDNCKIVAGHDGSRVMYDKDNPRTEIEIESMKQK